jgi:hypothetical protein
VVVALVVLLLVAALEQLVKVITAEHLQELVATIVAVAVAVLALWAPMVTEMEQVQVVLEPLLLLQEQL